MIQRKSFTSSPRLQLAAYKINKDCLRIKFSMSPFERLVHAIRTNLHVIVRGHHVLVLYSMHIKLSRSVIFLKLCYVITLQGFTLVRQQWHKYRSHLKNTRSHHVVIIHIKKLGSTKMGYPFVMISVLNLLKCQFKCSNTWPW